jgi:hypothetical protein
MISRRVFLASSAGMLLAGNRRNLLQEAIKRAGGEVALVKAKVLAWTGKAMVSAGGRIVEIGISTRVEPFVRARSDSWLLQDGPSKVRSLIIETDDGWIERDGQRTPMPAEMFAHERAQYALYGLMKLISARDAGARVEPGIEARTLIFHHPLAPVTTFGFASDARLSWATNEVPAADGRGRVRQRFDFSGERMSAGVHWPQRLQIAENGRPYFDLRLDTFNCSEI